MRTSGLGLILSLIMDEISYRVSDYCERILLPVSLKYGKDRHQYEMAEGRSNWTHPCIIE